MLCDYWPASLQGLQEFSEIAAAEQPEIDRAHADVAAMAQEFSAITLSEEGIRRWETILGISGQEADGFESRRFRIQARLLDQPPITKRTLYRQLEALCGEDGFTLTILPAEYQLNVRLALTSKYAFADVNALLRRVAPANLTIDLSLRYNQHQTFEAMTHAQLAAYTHQQLREDAI